MFEHEWEEICHHCLSSYEIPIQFIYPCFLHATFTEWLIQFACDLGWKNLKDLQVSIERFLFTWFGGPICSTQINCNKKVAWDPLCCKCDITVFKYGDSKFSIETCKSSKRRMTSCRSRFWFLGGGTSARLKTLDAPMSRVEIWHLQDWLLKLSLDYGARKVFII